MFHTKETMQQIFSQISNQVEACIQESRNHSPEKAYLFLERASDLMQAERIILREISELEKQDAHKH